MQEPIFITGLSIKPHYSFAYSYRLDGHGKVPITPRKHLHLTELSEKAKRRLVTAMQWMIFLSPRHSTYCKIQEKKFNFSINFITLTLSSIQVHSDKYIVHKMLRPMLKYLMRKGCKLYIWKAETQDNGNIHFHITTNHYVYWKSLRNKWNGIQAKHGYMKKYFDEHGDNEANSTDIHAVKNDKGIIAYMTKYMLKADRYKKNQSKVYAVSSHYYRDKLNEKDKTGRLLKRYIECALWNCSTRLSKFKLNITQEEAEFEGMIEYVKQNSNIIHCNKGTLYDYKDNSIFTEIFKMFDESNYNYN